MITESEAMCVDACLLWGTTGHAVSAARSLVDRLMLSSPSISCSLSSPVTEQATYRLLMRHV